jgi:hypothetical protein
MNRAKDQQQHTCNSRHGIPPVVYPLNVSRQIPPDNDLALPCSFQEAEDFNPLFMKYYNR